MPGISEMPNAPITQSKRAYRAVREKILNGDLLPGQWLRKRALASELNMSPTPVVEAMRRLEQDGLVESTPQWGVRVKVWTVDELTEAWSVRGVLEGLVTKRCAEVLTDEQIERLRPLAEKVDRDDEAFADPIQCRQFPRGWVNQDDHRFHRMLSEEVGLTLIKREIDRLQLLQATCRLLTVPGPPTTIKHVDILGAIASRDPDRAESLMRRAIDEGADQIIPLLRQRFGSGPITYDNLPAEDQDPLNTSEEQEGQ